MSAQSHQFPLVFRDVCYGYDKRRAFLGPVSFELGRGEVLAIVGPNGAGKSTLLRIAVGLLAPDKGEVMMGGMSFAEQSTLVQSRMLAYLPQATPTPVGMSAYEVVLMGRFPYRSWSLFESSIDHEIARTAMETTATMEFADRPIDQLSGGEAQRVHIAAALAQQAEILVLDEPIASLDTRHQIELLQLVTRLARDKGTSVLIVLHDINLTARFADRVLLLDNGQVVALGPSREVATPGVLEPVFGVRLLALSTNPGEKAAWLVPDLDQGELE